MKTKYMQSRRPASAQRQWWAAPVSLLATLLALPVNAVTIPDDPLTTGAQVAPNILFILDDSGSMAWRYMYNPDISKIVSDDRSIDSGRTGNNTSRDSSYGSDSSNRNAIYDQAYVTNTLYYDPTTVYQGWVGAGGNRLTGGTDYDDVYSNDHYVDHAGADTSSGQIDLSDDTQTFYVPKDRTETNTTALGNVKNYYRYQILEGNDGKVVRAEWTNERGPVSVTQAPFNGTLLSARVREYSCSWLWCSYAGAWANVDGSQGTNENNTAPAGSYFTFVVPSGVSNLTVSISGSDANANLYVRRNNVPTTSYVCGNNGTSNETCSYNNPDGGTWYIAVRAADANGANFANVSINASYSVDPDAALGCATSTSGYDWRKCEETTPEVPASVAASGHRTPEAEKTNFATWYSYHRTRIKAAKAGASEAFSPLGNEVRAGFWTLHQNGGDNYNIPVSQYDGRFVNNTVDDPKTPINEITDARTRWYNKLFSAQGSSGTPLQTTLDNAGKYFSRTEESGPYGPERGSAQLSCRQNFTILTTDGYWNGSTVNVGSDGDNNNGTEHEDTRGNKYRYEATAPYASSDSSTLADIAMKYWKSDLRTLPNNVPTTEDNPAFWQHMVTFGISIGLKGTLDQSSVDEILSDGSPRKGGVNVGWPKPSADSINNIDDLLHAAVNGHGAFVSASSPDAFTQGLSTALAAIAQRTSSYSNVATNAASLRTGGKVFNASYVSGIWAGSVKAWNLDDAGKPDTLAWSASLPAWASRKVYTFNGSSGATFPTTAQIPLLTRTGGPVDYPVSGTDNANYLKGDQSKEGPGIGQLRSRTSVLGDIVGSSPAYVEDTDTLYVGANDGMLHAFDVSDGKELFAYVPSLVNFSYLAGLSRGDYTHKFFVDGPIVVSDRKLTPNKNLLIGALGRGGKGLYGLDVSDPDAFGTGDVEWELAETAGKNMGLVLGRPFLTKVKTSTSTQAVAAVLGNGVNSTNHKAALLIVNAETGQVIREIDTGAGSADAPNGLSAATGVLGPDGRTLAYAYAGDLLGNVWKFDLTSSNPSDWEATKLFTAVSDVTGEVQPITGAVTVALEPRTYKYWVLFGTGSFMTVNDADDKRPLAQSMYGFIDSGTEVAYASLQKRTIINTGATQDGYPVRTFEAKASLPAGKKGWYVNLPANGERIVQDAQVVSNILVTASMLPTGDACEASGSGYINAVDAFTGTSAGKSFFDLDGDGDTSDNAIGGVPVGSVNFGVGMPTLPIFLDGRLIVGGTGGDSGGAEKPGSGGIVRKEWSSVSWREIKGD